MGSSKNMIYNSISFIESRLSDELSINELAGQIFFSKTHYKRLFQAVIGKPVMEYIKKRRLQRAGIMLCETGTSILDIALQFGYSSHEGFSRAFKEYFGMPPLQYRKRYKTSSYHGEVMDLITSEARKNIVRYAADIAKDLEALINELERCCAPAKNEIEKDITAAGGMTVSFEEWGSLIARMKNAKNDTLQLFAEEIDIYESFDKVGILMKTLDDMIFQMNLLRFLTGVERSRMGEYGIPFEPILNNLTALCETESNRKEVAVKLILEINSLIQAELKREAVGCIKQAAESMRERVKEGTVLTEKLNALVIEMGMYGRGFALIAKETEKATSCIRDIEIAMQRLTDKMESMEGIVFSASDHKSVHMAMLQLSENAFKMNVNAFNAAVETVRTGKVGEPGCGICAEEVRNYAGHLQHTHRICCNLNKECLKFIALIHDNDKNEDTHHFQKQLDDIAFQIGFLNTQLSLESERSERGDFRALSLEFDNVLDDLKHKIQRDDQIDKAGASIALKEFKESSLVIMEHGNSVAKEAGNQGAGIAYILNEYKLFYSRQYF